MIRSKVNTAGRYQVLISPCTSESWGGEFLWSVQLMELDACQIHKATQLVSTTLTDTSNDQGSHLTTARSRAELTMPLRMQNFVTRMDMSMHSRFYSRDLSREGQGHLVSRWTLSCSSKPLRFSILRPPLETDEREHRWSYKI